MADDEDIAALVIDNGSGMCKGAYLLAKIVSVAVDFRGLLLDADVCLAIGRLQKKTKMHGYTTHDCSHIY